MPIPDADDFRHAAVLASVDAVGEDPAVHPMRTGLSLCLPVADPVSSFTPLLLTLGGLVLGFAGLFAGAFVAEAFGKPPPGQSTPGWRVAAGLSLSVSGLLCLLTPVLIAPRWLRRRLGVRLEPIGTPDGPVARSARVEVEDTRTFKKLKLEPEDQAYLFLDPMSRCVHAEGLRFRYTVQAEDVLELEEMAAGGSNGLRIRFDAAGEPLDLVFKPDAPIREALRAYGGSGHRGFYARVRETLGRADA